MVALMRDEIGIFSSVLVFLPGFQAELRNQKNQLLSVSLSNYSFN